MVEWARHVVHLPGPQSFSSPPRIVLTFAGSMSTEFVSDPKNPVVIFMPEISRTHMGGTMRLGLRPTVFQQDSESSRIRKLYGGASIVWERHRHRYEVNPAYVEQLHTSGLAFIGRDEKGERMQIMELPSVFSALPRTAALYLLIHSLQNIPSLLACRPTQNSARAPSIRHHRSLALWLRLVAPMFSSNRWHNNYSRSSLHTLRRQ